MACVEAKRDRSSIRRTHSAMRTQNEKFGIKQARSFPTHAGILGETEEVAGRLRQQHLCRDRKRTFRTAVVCLRFAKDGAFAFENPFDRN